MITPKKLTRIEGPFLHDTILESAQDYPLPPEVIPTSDLLTQSTLTATDMPIEEEQKEETYRPSQTVVVGESSQEPLKEEKKLPKWFKLGK